LGRATGYVINWTPDRAERFDPDGNLLEVLLADKPARKTPTPRLSPGAAGSPRANSHDVDLAIRAAMAPGEAHSAMCQGQLRVRL
jgi:hypothetical protein